MQRAFAWCGGRGLAALVLLVLLPASQRTLLSQSPVDSVGCDAALVGH